MKVLGEYVCLCELSWSCAVPVVAAVSTVAVLVVVLLMRAGATGGRRSEGGAAAARPVPATADDDGGGAQALVQTVATVEPQDLARRVRLDVAEPTCPGNKSELTLLQEVSYECVYDSNI